MMGFGLSFPGSGGKLEKKRGDVMGHYINPDNFTFSKVQEAFMYH